MCSRHGVAVANYFALASGFLSGKYRRVEDAEGRARAARVKNYFNERGLRILDALDAVAKRLHTTPSTVAIAWTMAQPAITSAIASATSIAQLDELLKAVELDIDAESTPIFALEDWLRRHIVERIPGG